MTTRKPPRLYIRFIGDDEEGDVRLDELADRLERIVNGLREIERSVLQKRGLNYVVVELVNESSGFVVEPRPINRDVPMNAGRQVVRTFKRSMAHLGKGRFDQVPSTSLDTLSKIVPSTDDHMRRIEFRVVGEKLKPLVMDEKYQKTFFDLWARETSYEYGSVEGSLEAVNLHKDRKCRIYPIIGPTSIDCSFKAEQMDQVLRALAGRKWVRIYGELRYKPRSNFADHIAVDEIEELPDEKDLPKLSDLRNMSPGLTEGKNVRDYLEELRAEDE
ncbi:MAG: hypothetical protein KY459_01505 [Acidobacteria bacterium]|nr:hypothetical protein [Acidobacteriota bacterium]